MEEFYVGYATEAPQATGRFVRNVAAIVLVSFLLVAGGIVFALQPFPRSYFGFGTVTAVEGVADGAAVGGVWLVGQGKRGFDAGHGQRVRVHGAPIERDGVRLLEVESIEQLGPADTPPEEDLGPVTVTGEIVDSKCYFGVMNPGAGKVHKDCARNCLRGGVPAALVSKDAIYFIDGLLDERLSGERVRMSGRAIRRQGRLLLRPE